MRSFVLPVLTSLWLAGPAWAKLPPLDEAAKTKAAETAAKTAWTEKVGLYKHCLVTDRIAKSYRKTAPTAAPAASGAAAPIAIAACEDPGPFTMPVAAKPAEAAGAQSASATAASPPSTKPTAAELSANPKATPTTPAKDKPIEAAEAHSPPGTAVAPPSTKETAKDLGTGKK